VQEKAPECGALPRKLSGVREDKGAVTALGASEAIVQLSGVNATLRFEVGFESRDLDSH
jgi:hypothetical protein